MLNCPVCNTKYTEVEVDTCSTCGWYLKDESVKTFSPSVAPWGQQLEALKKAEVWATHIWEKNKQLFDESKLPGKQTLEESSLTKTKLEEESEHQRQLQGFEREREQLKTDLEQSNASLKQSNTKCEELQSQLQQLTQERDELLLNFNQSHQKYEEKNVLEEKQQEFERKLKV
jgi:DNA repair exonuclease SbcCD ATPase subunit